MSPYRRPARWLRTNGQKITLGIFILGTAVALAVGLIAIGKANRAEAKQDRAEATRVATIQTQYVSCVASIPLLTKINEHFAGQDNINRRLIRNARRTHNTTPKDSPQWRAQVVNIAGLRRDVRRGMGVRVPVPTKATCAERRAKALKGGET